MQYTEGRTRPERHRGSLRAATARGSSDSNVFTRMPSASGILRIVTMVALYVSLSESWSTSRTRCEAGMGGRPKKSTVLSPRSLKLARPSSTPSTEGSWMEATRVVALKM